MKHVQAGYNRQELRKINEQISADIANEGIQRKCCVGMVRIDGVLIPHGWIHPSEQQIQTKLASMGSSRPNKVGLQGKKRK